MQTDNKDIYKHLVENGQKRLAMKDNISARDMFLKALRLGKTQLLYVLLSMAYYQNCDFCKAILVIKYLLLDKNIQEGAEIELKELLSYCYLSRGELESGWKFYGYRKPARLVRKWLAENCNLPFWQGEILPDTNLLVVAEDGIGDELIYTAFLSLLTPKVKSVYLECDVRLKQLFARTYPDITFFERKNSDHFKKAKQACNKQVLLGDLPRYLNPQMALGKTIPLVCSPARTDSFRKKLLRLCGKKTLVGVSYYTPMSNARTRMPARTFWDGVFRSNPEIAFINLQENSKTDPKKRSFLYNHENLHQLEEIDLYNDIEGVADLVCAMDFVVTVSNYIAHLAGSLHKSSVIISQKFCNCRWLLTEQPIAWYPKMTLIKSEQCNTWVDVKEELLSYIKSLTS